MALQDVLTALQVAQQTAQQIGPWLPVATFIIGQLFAIVLEWLRGIAAARRERTARDQVRKEAVEDRRAEFQRQTLVELQETLLQFMRATAQMRFADERSLKETGKWGQTLFDEELSEHERQLRVRINVLTQRALDDNLRDLVGAYSVVLKARDKRGADLADVAATEVFQQANDRLGELLRALY